MKKLQRKRFLHFLFIFLLYPGIFLVMLSIPSLAAAQEADRENITSKAKKFQIEFYGGYSSLNPSDLNMRLDYDREIQHFFYDDYYDYLVDNYQIASWSKETNVDLEKIKKSFPFGFRLKYFMNNSIAFSLGFKYLSRKQTRDFIYEYTRVEGYATRYLEQTEYSPYTISVEGYTAMLGVHFLKKIGNFGIEGYIQGGPLFAECMFVSHWNSDWLYQGNNYTFLMHTSNGRLEEKGKGTGYVLDFGGRINIPLVHRLGLFIELGYALQKANKVSGPGTEIRDGNSKSWDNQWIIKEENIQTPWGSIVLQSPTSYREGWTEDQRVRDFKLDLSGFQLRMGISFCF